ncbi:hypothetical protein LCGC14_2318700, partial [marine sediment metagenome]
LYLSALALAGADAPAKGPVKGRSPATRPARGLLSWSDFKYLGAFRAPRLGTSSTAGSRYGFSATVMCWNPKGDPGGERDGFVGSIMMPGHPSKQLIGEFSIPRPKILTDADKQADGTYDTRRLPMAKQLGRFSDPSGGKKNVFEKRVENWGGMCWDGDEIHLSWNLWYHVDSGAAYHLSHMAARKRPDGTWKTTIEPYALPIRSHRINGYVAVVPKWWADAHLGGRRLLGGLNICQGVGASNCGPGLYAFDPKAPAAVLTLMEFPHAGKSAKTHDDDWRPSDLWRGLAFVDTGAKYAVMFCGRKSLGEVRYGIGRPTDASRSKGYHCDPYRPEIRFYDPAALLAVLKGAAKPHQPRPYAKIDLTKVFFQPDRAFLTAGIGYDPVNRLLYIAQVRGDRDSARYEAVPVIHVWRIVKP